MRLIDADELKKDLKDLKAEGYNQKYVQGLQDAIDNYFPQIIDDAPTADVQLVKHGRWIRSDDQCWLTCPFCDTDVDVSCGAPFFYVDNDEVSHINFCPNCGARMDGDNNG